MSFRWPLLEEIILCGLLAAVVIVVIRAGLGTPIPKDASTDASATAVTTIQDQTRQGLSARNAQANSRSTGYEVHVNDEGGYLFSYPDTWEITSGGNEARLSSPAGDVGIMFGMAPPGSLETASDRVLHIATSSYSSLELVGGQVERTIQGLRSLVVGGDALTSTGAPVRFIVITIQAPDENRAITVQFSPSADPLDALPAIQEIVSSFRISQAE